MGIQRFDAGSGVNPRANGQFVLHCDHEAILEQVGLLWAHKLVERDNEIDRLRAELAAKSKDADALQAVVTSIQEYAASLEYTGKWANADDDDSCRHNIAREIQELMGEGNDPAKA